jgi:dihydroorotate dehydrogenase electron transfer subunit
MIQECGALRRKEVIHPEIFDLWLECPEVAHQSHAGQYLHLLIKGATGVTLRRPLSIAGIEGGLIRLLVRIVGEGTSALAAVPVGTIMDVIGPLGIPFDYSKVSQALLVGGGIGGAPLLFLQDELIGKSIPTDYFLGAKTQDEYPLDPEEVERRSIFAATDDGTFGSAGFVSLQVNQWLQHHDHAGVRVYSCGPLLMMREVDRICRLYDLPHQASLENRMGCGIGVCQGCAVRVNDGKGDPRGGYRLVCKDGPVFDAMEIEWAVLGESYR